jgi:hypothetical protein
MLFLRPCNECLHSEEWFVLEFAPILFRLTEAAASMIKRGLGDIVTNVVA